MRADNTRHIVAAARQRTEQTRERAVTTLRRMDAAGQPVTLASLASQAGVSRSWLYRQDDLRAEIERLRDHRRPSPGRATVPGRQRASSTSLLLRLEAAADRIRRLEAENQQLRDALARALGERRTAGILGPAHSRDTPNKQNPKIIAPC
jgi:Family of unknown function (DUF6262)